ncbi:MAG TPA: sugar phosphate nucleotidyltransferase [Gemmatimonadaceae bacterium]|nr:sugar phosphate nucleotidyltransferase [Gemmatimonadaceae bacterium]
MRAVLLAGGRGTRLAPYTTVFPKPLVPVGDIPIIEIILRQLQAQGVKRVTLAVGYLAELIRAYLEQRSDVFPSLTIDYVTENSPTGTAGALGSIPDLANEPFFLVMNGDVLSTIDISAMIEHHKKEKADLTIATYSKVVKLDLGVLDVADGNVVGYHEKPSISHDVSMGIYLYSPTAHAWIQRDTYLDFPDLILKMIAAGQKVSSYRTDCLWLDIGRHEDYALATEIFESNRDAFLPGVAK